MTIVLALKCRDGVVLAADSQRTEGGFRQTVPKLFTSESGIAWGAAGNIGLHQELDEALQALELPRNPGRREAKEPLVRTVKEIGLRGGSPGLDLQAIFAWHSAGEGETYLLRVLGDGRAEFLPYTAVGNPADKANFALSRSEHFEFWDLPIEPAKVIAFLAAEDVIKATSSGVALPVQVAVVTPKECCVLSDEDTLALRDATATFRERQRDQLVGPAEVAPEADTGVRP